MAAVHNGEGRPEAATANASFMAGYNARTPVEKAGILTDFEALARPFMAGRTGKLDATAAEALAWYRDADAGAELERIRREHPGDKGRLRAAVAFFNAASAYEGLLAGARDRMDNAATSARQDLRRMTYGGDGGHLQPLTLRDGRQVYLVSGRAAEHRSPAWEVEDSIDSLLRRLRMGNLDPEMSDRTLVVADPVTGRLEMIPARRVRSVGELVPFDGEAERLEAEARERTARREAAEIDGATVVLTAAPVAEDAASETAAAPAATAAEDAATVSQAAPAAPVAEDAATAVPGQEIAAEAGIPAPEVPLELNDRLDFTGPDGGAVRAEIASVPDTDGQMDVLITDGSGRERVERLTADGVRGLGTLTHRNGEPVGAAEAAEAREAAAQPSGTAAQTDAAEADNASAGPNETDGNGYPFVKSSDGTTAFGEVREESGLQPAPIRLSEGFNRADGQGGNIGYGLEHIKAGHGEQILKAGYRSVEEFVEDVARNYQEIRIGRSRRNNRTYMLLELHDEKHKRTLYVELSHDGTYWNVNSGGIFKSKYTDKNDIAWPEPTVGSSASTGAAGVVGSPAKAAEGETADRGGNSPQPISAGKVSANPPNGQAGGPETGAAPADGRVTGTGQRLAEEQADVLLSAMEAAAEEAPELELTPENWVREFGEDGRVGTPVGEVKMGEHQLAKLFMKGRSGYFGMIRPTLENPDVIVEKPAPSEGAERDSKYLFIKSFTKPDGSRVVHFESVTVRRDGLEVSTSSHEAEARDIKKDMQNGNVLHINEKLPLSSEWSLTEAPAREGSDLVPTPGNVSTGKGSQSAATGQGETGKSSPAGPERASGAAVEAPRLEGMPEWHMDAPEDARKRGARRYGGQLFTRQEPVRGVVGKEIAVKFSQKDLPRGHVVVMEASQLQPSHVQGQRNPMFFIDEAQPKNRTDAVSRYAAQRMAEGIRPEEITGSVTAYTGAPTVNSRGEVIQGNNRSDALRFLWESRLPEQQAAYTQYLTDSAERFGIDAEAVRGMRQPVLVNMLDVDDAEAIRLGQMTAQDTESGGVERIRPKNLAQKLGDGMRQFANMLLGSADDEATFGQLVDLNGAEVMKWLNQTGAISSTQYQSAFDRKGNLTPEAKNDLQKVLYQSVFKGGPQQLEELFEKLPSKAQRAILATAYRDMDSPSAGKMLHEIQASIVAYSELMRTADFAAARKMENVLWAVESFRRQIALDDRFKPYMPADNFSNFALHLAAMYKASDFSQKTLAATFSQMYDLAQGKVGATLFEEADTTEHPLAEVIEKVLGIKYKPAKNGNGNVANGGPSVALPDQTGQGGEPRGNEPPAVGEQAPPAAGPSERGGRAADDGAAARAEAALTGNAPAGPDGQKWGPAEGPAAESPVSVIDKARQAVAAEEAKAGRRAGEDGRMAGRGLSPDEARRVVAWMEGSAAVAPELGLTPENWHAEFGEDGRVATPIAEVRMGDNQYLKIAQQGRNGKLGMVKPTLEHPMAIIEDERPATDGNGERPSAYVFVRAFVKKDGSRHCHFTSVTVSKDGHEVVISNQEKSAKRISTLLRQGKVAWIDKGFSLHPTAQIEEPVPLNDTNRPTTPGSQPALLGINSSEPKVTSGNAPANATDTGKTLPDNGNGTATPESTVSSAGKDSENGGNGQGKAGKSAVEEAAAEPPYGRPYTSAADFLETAHSEIPGDDRLDGATVRKLKAFVERALKKRLGWATEVDERGARVDSATVKGLYSSEKGLFWPFRDHGASWIDDGEKAVYYLAYYPAQYKGQDDVVRVRKEYFEEGTGTEAKGFSTDKSAENSRKTSKLGEKIAEAEAKTGQNPTEKRKEAGNYKKGHVQIGTFDVTIENPKGSVRSGVDANGKKWETEMHNTYGYIRGTEGVDGDHIDVFLTDDIDSWDGRKVFVIDQYNTDGSFDEHKVMLGFNSAEEAHLAYLSNYEKGWQDTHKLVGTPVNLEDFEKWINSSHRKTKAFAEYSNVKKQQETEQKQNLSRFNVGDVVRDYYTGKLYRVKKFTKTGVCTIVELDSNGKEIRTTSFNAEKNPRFGAAEAPATATTEEKSKEEAPGTNVGSTASTDGYSVEPAQYTTKRGKVLDMQLVKFDRELSKEETRNAKAIAKELKGWYDKEKGGFMMRSTEDAQELAAAVMDESGEALEDAAPLSMSDVQEASGVEVAEETKEAAPTEQEAPADNMHKLVTNERYEQLKKRMMAKLNQLNMGIDPEMLAIGTEMAVYHIEGGARKFAQYAKAMITDMGDAIRPYLKSFYNAVRDLPEAQELANSMDSYDDVSKFDVANFDKASTNAMATAEMVVAESEAEEQATEAKEATTNQRNAERRQKNEQTTADTEAITSKATTIARDAERRIEEATTEEQVEEAQKKADKQLQEIDKQLAELDYVNSLHSGMRVVLKDGRKVTATVVMHQGERISATQMSKPRVGRVYAVGRDGMIDFTPDEIDVPATIAANEEAERRRLEFEAMVERNESPYTVTPEVEEELKKQSSAEVINGYKRGDKVVYTPSQRTGEPTEATIHDFEPYGSHRPVLDTGMGPVIYEVADWADIKPVNSDENHFADGREKIDITNPTDEQLGAAVDNMDDAGKLALDIVGYLNPELAGTTKAKAKETLMRTLKKSSDKVLQDELADPDIDQEIRKIIEDELNNRKKAGEKKPKSKKKNVASQTEVADLFSDLFADEQTSIEDNATPAPVDASMQRKFALAVKDDMLAALDTDTKPYRSIIDLRKRASELGMEVDNDGRTDILLQELVEDGLVRAAREVVKKYGRDSRESYDLVCKLYDMQPAIAARSSNRIKMQQYSTPLPMSWIADRFAMESQPSAQVLEPTAGNGMLVFTVPVEQVHANELDETRLDNLREQGFAQVTQQDATEPFEGGKKYDAVIANPPFGKREAVEYDGKMIPGLDPQITLNALASMKDDGRAAIIIGGNMAYANNGGLKGLKPFFTYLYDHYNVSGVIDMDGSLYAKQGTTFPTRMILINGRRSEEERAQTAIYPPVKSKALRKAESFENLYEILNEVLNSNEKTNGTEVLRSQGGRPLPVTDNTSGKTDRAGHHRQSGKNDKTGSRTGGRRRTKLEGSSQNSQRPVSGEHGQNETAGKTGRGTGAAGGPANVGGGLGQRAVGNGTQRVDDVASRRSVLGLTPKKRDLTEEKLPYRPHNKAFSLESVAPAAMVEAMDNVLSQIEKENGSIDEFIKNELGYASVEEAHGALAAEQMDSVAMAIYQMKKGQALIIGDQTGVGKGRQMAALIRWAAMRGEKPVFITQKADLFSDIYRDLVDIGSGDLVPFIFNSPSGKENKGEMVDANGKVVYKGLSDAKMKKVMATGQLPEDCDYAVLTYSQVNTGDEVSQQELEDAAKKRGARVKKSKASKEGKATPKATFLRTIANDNYLFLDESHTAAGSSNTGAYLQSILRSAKAATFASATFAKRPDTMPLYAIRTAMSQAKVEPDKMIGIIEKGGVTLQEIMSRELTNAGQMVRRERDMSDVVTDWKTINDPETVRRARDNYDRTIAAFNAIIKFQEDYVKPKIEELDIELAITAESAGIKRGTNKLGVENVPFASKAYNYTKQLMLALKVDAIADEVEAEIKAGRHPVIALESTMESTIEDYSDGETIAEPTFSANLLKGLDSVMQYTVKDENGKERHANYTPRQLGEAGEKAYYELQQFIRESTSDIFISPLDAIIERLHKKGYKVGELTGRNLYVEISDSGKAIVRRRTDRDKKKMQREFNNGTLDVLILNKSASTGISLHASEKFSDQRQRTMIIAQPLSDINDYMQMIGRIDRTGQVHRGYYINLGLPVPAENRFLMMLSTKLKSLNANTTTSQDSESNEVEAPDLLNKYGSQVVVEYLRDNAEVYDKMGAPLKKAGAGDRQVQASELEEYKPQEDDARKITGYVALLSTKEQEEFYDDVVRRYNELIKYLNDTGSNDLKISVMPLRATTLDKRVSSEGIDPDGSNPFARNSYVEKVEMDVLRKPMKAEEVKKVIAQINNSNADEHLQTVKETINQEDKARIAAEEERYEKAKTKAAEDIAKQAEKINRQQKRTAEEKAEAIARFTADTDSRVEEKHDDNIRRMNTNRDQLLYKLDMFEVGKTYLVPETLESLVFDFASPAIFCGYKAKDKKITASTTLAVFATLDGRRRVEVKLSDGGALMSIYKMTNDNLDFARSTTLDNWDEQIPNETRKQGFIMTGNILQAIADTQDEHGGYPGQLISYTDIDGNVHDGILMPDKWKPSMLKSSGAPIISRLKQIQDYQTVESADGKVRIEGSSLGHVHYLVVPKTKKGGAMFYENKRILNAVSGSIFYPYRGQMRADIPAGKIKVVVDELSKLGVKVKSEEDNDTLYRSDDKMVEDAGREPRPRQDGAVTDAQISALNDEFANDYRNGDGEYSDDELSYENDPIAKWMGKSSRSKAQRRAFAEREGQRMAVRVNELAEKLGLDNVEVVTDSHTLEGRKQRAKGFFSKGTGKITIVIPNHANVFDVEQTLLHEAVAHYGLRKLFGEHFDTFLGNVYKNADASIRREIVEMAKQHDWDFRTATEEYLAGLAENTDFEHTSASWWSKIKSWFLDMLHQIGFEGFSGVTLTDSELRYLLWRSYENLKEPGRYRSILGEAADVAKQYELKVGNYQEPGRYRNVFAVAEDVAAQSRLGVGDHAAGDGPRESRVAEPARDMASVNARFNGELQRYTEGRMGNNEMFRLGLPQGAMRAFLPNLPIVMRQRVVSKGTEKKHQVGIEALHDMPQMISEPIMVFQRDADTIGILTEMRDREGKNVCVAIEMRKSIQSGKEALVVNDVRSFHGREVKNIVLPVVNNGTLRWVDKPKALDWLSSASQQVQQEIDNQELSSAAKVVEKFGNPPVEARKNEDDGILFRDGDGEGPLVPSSSGLDAGEMASRLRQEADRGAAREREGAAAVRERRGVNVRDAYDRQVASSAYQSVEALQDSVLGLKTLMMDIWKAEGRERTGLRHIEDIPAFENAYLAENRMSSANKAQADEYTRDFMAPLLEEVRRLTYGAGAGRRKAVWKRNYGGVTDYMMAKHGLERNEVMARREAERKFARERRKAERQLARIEARHAGTPGALEGDSAYQELQDRLQDIDGRVEAQYLENRKKDYAGLTGLTGADTVAVAEENAREAVASFEAAHETAELWRLVNAATGQTLRTLYEAGLLDKARYEEIRGMYAHYIPLRGFAGTTSDEVYGYLEDRDALERGNILKRARGRRTKADDPLATVAAMAEAGIAQANRNRMKQAFMNFAINHPSDAVAVGDMWLHYDGADGQWHPVFPDIGAGDDAETVARKLKDFNAAMRERAREAPEDYLHGKDAVGVPYIIRPGDMREHQVIVRRGGRDFVLTVNGSPRAAQALNGLSNPSSIEGKLLQAAANVAGYVTRAMSQWYTQRNPSFVMGNFIRDMQYANSTVWVKESAAYARRFNLNCAKYNPAALRALFHKYRRGTLDMGKPVEKYFHEFMHEGGETGSCF